MEHRRVLRITRELPGGSYDTHIYVRRLFGWKLVIRYIMKLTEMRTIGSKESAYPSVPKEYGDHIGYTFIQHRIKL